MDDTELVTASDLEKRKILKRAMAYKLSKKGVIPSYSVGRGIRFRVNEVLGALRRPAVASSVDTLGTDYDTTINPDLLTTLRQEVTPDHGGMDDTLTPCFSNSISKTPRFTTVRQELTPEKDHCGSI